MYAVSHDEDEREEGVHRKVNMQICVAIADGLWRDLVGAEEDVQIRAVYRQQQAGTDHNGGYDGGDDERLQRALADARVVAGAEVLRGEARHGGAEAVERCHKQVVELVRCAEAVLRRVRDHDAVEYIELHHNALHHDDAD